MWLGAAAAVAFGAGVLAGAAGPSAAEQLAERYTRAWARGDLAAMHGMLTEDARRRTSFVRFRDAHRRAAVTATAVGISAGAPQGEDGGVVAVPMAVVTRVFGTVRAPLALPVDGGGDAPGVGWAPHLAFPGVRSGEELDRRTRLPTRASIRAADGTLLAGGARRVSADAQLAASIAGSLGPIPRERAEQLRAQGVPPDARVGLTGLERALDDELRGRPGGVLRAGRRVLAVGVARPAGAVRATIAPRVQRAAVAAIGDRIGGVVALDTRTGAVTAAAGIGLSGLQPPGSTFKVVTLAGALEAGLTRPGRRYPVETSTTLEGVELENANGEACGGTLFEAFAESCNSVFAPLGAQLGAERLVATAERFGFNRPPGIDGAATSVIPPPGEIGDDLAVGATAIGQGRLQASALQMAIVAATIARQGERPIPTLRAGAPPRAQRAISARVARVVGRGMRAVVREGTGTAAAIEGVGVAGKTGTAELRSTVTPDTRQPGADPSPPDPTDTDAWFVAYAPYTAPRVAVGVLLVESGAGSATAAPAARLVLTEALRRRG